MIKTFWAKKLAQEKSAKFMKIFELYQVFMHNFLSQNVLIPPIIEYLRALKQFLQLPHTFQLYQ